MPTVRLEFELDSEIYPELHATLSALSSSRARAERMRQLAAAGLVWEKVRLHGSAALVAPADEPRTDLVTRPDVSATPPGRPALERRSAGSRRSRSAPAGKPREGELIDLAINAEPTPVPPAAPERRRHRPSREEVEQVMRELPVLTDVVTDVESDAEGPALGDVMPRVVPDVHPLRAPDDPYSDEEPARWATMNAYPDDLPDTMPGRMPAEGDDDAEDGQASVLHVTALSHKPATRSRLMRMKERGLFKNG